MSYYQFNKREILQKAKKKKEKKEKSKNKYKNMTDEEKQAKKEYQRNYCKKLESYQNEQLLEKAKRGEKSG